MALHFVAGTNKNTNTETDTDTETETTRDSTHIMCPNHVTKQFSKQTV